MLWLAVLLLGFLLFDPHPDKISVLGELVLGDSHGKELVEQSGVDVFEGIALSRSVVAGDIDFFRRDYGLVLGLWVRRGSISMQNTAKGAQAAAVFAAVEWSGLPGGGYKGPRLCVPMCVLLALIHLLLEFLGLFIVRK